MEVPAFIILFVTPIAIICTIAFAIAWISARGRAIRAEALLEGVQRGGPQRRDSISQELQGLAIEVERIAESQRFLARALTERQTPSEPQRPWRVITPH